MSIAESSGKLEILCGPRHMFEVCYLVGRASGRVGISAPRVLLAGGWLAAGECHPECPQGECINSSVACKRCIAEWGALHTAERERLAPSVAAVTLTMCAAAATVFFAALFVLLII
ncbi:unnamed protein product [Parnassius apollo]|uniref:(apollo) hypothetical protein n=1 Tax=Parnassius apollo TaxID=110799 RepID=A0A8S3W632_PARAO|nr:unnamed protein product [Parnassius apollo]